MHNLQHGFIGWHDGPAPSFLRGLLGDLRDRIWKLEADFAALCSEEVSGPVAFSEAVLKKNEEKASVSAKLASKEWFLLYGIVIFICGLLLGMFLG